MILLGKTFDNDRVVPRYADVRAEEEMRKYMEAPYYHSQKTPQLVELAKHYLCIPGTGVAAERVFSTAGDIVTAQRSTLSPEHVDQLLFLQKNLEI